MIFSPQSKVWIYQSNRAFTAAEAAAIQQKLDGFTAQWTAHGHQLKAKAVIPYNFFIVFIVDQNVANATGCSID
ncbi:MAG: ABC transporter ATPase, partial [Bacteroidia bacterium]